MRYVHTNSAGDPAVADSVEVDDDGAVRGWRSVADGAVGSFAGRLDPQALDQVRAAVAGVAGIPPPTGPRLPDSGVESVEVAGHDPVAPPSQLDEARPWGRLTALARGLVSRLPQWPDCAVTIGVGSDADGDAGWLRRAGNGEAVVDLSAAVVRVTRWRGYYEPAGDTSTVIDGPRQPAGPGWSYRLPVDLGPSEPDITVHVSVTFTLMIGDAEVRVQLTHSPPITAR